MIHIKKSKAGFRVVHTGKNGEILNSSEVLTTKAKAWKNIRAMAGMYEVWPGPVSDETRNKPVIYVLANGVKTKK